MWAIGFATNGRGLLNLLSDIVNTLQPYIDDEGLAVPLEAHVARARK